MKRLLPITLLLAGCGEPSVPMMEHRPIKVVFGGRIIEPEPEMIAVPSLHGPDYEIPVTQLHRIKPLGWAMLIDFNRMDERTTNLYLKACQDNPKLEGEVNRLFGIKASVASRIKARQFKGK